MTDKLEALIYRALDSFNIELPSWGFANTGTRFGKFVQAAAANTVEEKFSDAGQVHALTGSCPTIALHIQWDMPKGVGAGFGHPEISVEIRSATWLDQSQCLSGSGI